MQKWSNGFSMTGPILLQFGFQWKYVCNVYQKYLKPRKFNYLYFLPSDYNPIHRKISPIQISGCKKKPVSRKAPCGRPGNRGFFSTDKEGKRHRRTTVYLFFRGKLMLSLLVCWNSLSSCLYSTVLKYFSYCNFFKKKTETSCAASFECKNFCCMSGPT